MRWYRNGETHRFHQPLGKQYTYNKGIGELSEVERLNIRIKQPEMHNELLGKLNGILRTYYYNNERLQLKLNKLPPIKFREQFITA